MFFKRYCIFWTQLEITELCCLLQLAALYIYVNSFIFLLPVDVLVLSALKYSVWAESLSGWSKSWVGGMHEESVKECESNIYMLDVPWLKKKQTSMNTLLA